MNPSCTYRITIIAFFAVLANFSCKESSSKDSSQVVVTPASVNKPGDEGNVSTDKSPMDMAYFPVEYPKLKMSSPNAGLPIARIIYSRPIKEGRVIFGDVIKYGSPWRVGANEATEIEFFRDVKQGDTLISKGRYILYCIPQESSWKIILNGDLYTWGLKINPAKDMYSFTVPVAKARFPIERLTIDFAPSVSGMDLRIAWDSVRVMVPFSL